MLGWWYKDNLLTWEDTGQQWSAPHWDDSNYTKFLAMDFDSQRELLEQLEEVEEA